MLGPPTESPLATCTALMEQQPEDDPSAALRGQLGSMTEELQKELETIRQEMATMQHTLHHDLAKLQQKGMRDLQELDTGLRQRPAFKSKQQTQQIRTPVEEKHSAASIFDAKTMAWVVVLLLIFGPFWPTIVELYEAAIGGENFEED